VGLGDTPNAVRLVDGRYAAQPRWPHAPDAPAQPCVPALGSATHGTAGSATVVIAQDDVQLQRLSIANDAMDAVRAGQGYPPGAGEGGGAQAVALLTRGDRLHLREVALWGHQDTFYADRARPDAPARVLVERSTVAGDVDFVFGAATLVIDDSLILSRAGRRAPGERGIGLAPSTAPQQTQGFLVTHSRWLAEPGVAPGSVHLGRAWDAGVPKGGPWTPTSPNGRAVVRDSLLGAHLTGWTASTARRPFDPAVNRLAEFGNAPLPAAAFEALPEGQGWASVEGGTRGGSAAKPEHVLAIRSRADLDAALRLGDTPKVLAVMARIDLDPLGAEAYRDPAFDAEAYERTYDPAVWGRRPPSGPLEEARLRSAKRQAAATVVRIPSNTTLIGVVPGAGFVRGGLMLDRVQQVIVRHLAFADAYDHFPQWDPLDGALGEWNSEYDNLSLRGARHVWVDHCRFDDGERPDHLERTVHGRQQQRHDGLLDITQQSDLVTVSWSHFEAHDKTMLIGSSDKAVADAGRLRVTLHHNRWVGLAERTPRVRFGQVHVMNNLFEPRPDSPYGYGYSIGVGVQSAVLSQANAWEGPVPATKLLRVLKGEAFSDQGSTLNGQPIDWRAAFPALAPVTWTPPYTLAPEPAATAAQRVREGAGPRP
jgi:pectate lyase